MLKFLCRIGLVCSGQVSVCGSYFKCDFCGKSSEWKKGIARAALKAKP
jgi:hypothetical protein